MAHTLDQVLHQEPVSPQLINPQIPRDLETICLRCLQKNPDQRFSSAKDLADELKRFLAGEPIHSRPAGPVEKLWRYCRRKPALSGLAAAVALLFLVVAIGSPIMAWRIRNSERTLAENLYAADMKLVELSVTEGNWGRARALLHAHVPSRGARDLRGFEWAYFNELAKGDQLKIIQAHSNLASAVVFSPDGRTIATAGFDGFIKFWDSDSLRFRSQIFLPGKRFTTLSYRSDGQMLAAATDASGAYVWHVNSRQLVTNFTGRWTFATFARSGPQLALCGGRVWGDGEGPLRVWDSARLEEVRSWPAAGSRVAWAADGNQLFSGPIQGGIARYDLQTGQYTQFDRAEGFVHAIACSPDGKLLAASVAGASNPTHEIWLWEIASRKLLHQLRGHTANVWAIAFSNDGRFLVSASSDQSIRVWELSSGQLYGSLQGHDDEVWSVAIGRDGRNLASVGKGGALLWWALPEPRNEELNTQVTAIPGPRVFSPDGQTMAVGIGQDRVALVDLPTEHVTRIIENAACAIGYEDDGKALITIGPGGLRRASLAGGETSALHSLSPPLPQFDVLRASPDRQFLVAELEPGQLGEWDLRTGRLVDQVPLPSLKRVTFLTFSPDGKQLAVVREGVNEVLLFSSGLRDMRAVKHHAFDVWSAAYSSDGRIIATASVDGKVVLWRSDTTEVIGRLEGHKEGVFGVAFSPDDKTVAALCGNRSVKLWNVPTRREVANLPFKQISAYVDFSPDGQTLVACKPWAPEPRFEFWHSRLDHRK